VIKEGFGAAAPGDARAVFGELAERFVAQGEDLTILISDLAANLPVAIEARRTAPGPHIVFLSDLVRADLAMTTPVHAAAKAYAVYRYLAQQDFDAAHFVESGGLGFYAALARAQGRLRTCIVTYLTGPTRWRRALNLDLPDISVLETETLELGQFEYSDLMIAPSQAAVDCVAALGWPAAQIERVERLRLAPVRGGAALLSTRALAPGEISELIFLGTQDRGGGIDLVIDAARRLQSVARLDLTFVGRFGRVEGEFSASRVLRLLPDYSGRIRFLDDLGYADALRWIATRERALCILPALDRFGPAGIDDCFAIGAPFLATDVGGASEFLDEPSRIVALAPADAESFAQALVRTLENGMPALRSSLDPKAAEARWHELRALMWPCAPLPVPAQPLVSVCIAHRDRPALLERALAHLMQQTYENIEIVIVDDGSRRQDTLAKLDEIERRAKRFALRVVRSENRYLGAARNLAARHARGEFLLFHDDDNFAETNEVEVFVNAALRTNADILTSHFWVVREDETGALPADRKIEAFFVGGGGIVSLLKNWFGDANALVRRQTFEALGGFSEMEGVGCEDWEFFLRAHFLGAKTSIVPEPLFNYRVSPGGMLSSGSILRNHERIFATIDSLGLRLDANLARLAAKPLVDADIRERLLRLFEPLQGGPLHAQLLDLDPASPAAAAKLAELREQSAWSSDNPVSTRIVLEKTSADAPALLLSGWAFVETGKAYVPQLWSIDSRLYRTVAGLAYPRPDVSAQFGLSDDSRVGFFALLLPTVATTWLRRRRMIGSSVGSDVATFDKMKGQLRAHVDVAGNCRLAPIEPPFPSWRGAIELTSERKAICALWSGDRLLDSSTISPGFRRRMLVETPLSAAKAIVPADGKSWIQFD
jgi:GT2 family glycosyltransferase/glycosyltransferase involved in cell wall biosynthesis